MTVEEEAKALLKGAWNMVGSETACRMLAIVCDEVGKGLYKGEIFPDLDGYLWRKEAYREANILFRAAEELRKTV